MRISTSIRYALIWALLALSAGLSRARQSDAPLGQPFQQFFSPEQYRGETQNWAVAQDGEGRMYFGNGAGVLLYDGGRWQRVATANRSVVRSLAYAPDGRLYVGAKAEFGYIDYDAQGRAQYVSLKERLDTAYQGFGDVWQIIPTADGLCFNAGNFVFVHREGAPLKAIAVSGQGLHRAYGLENQFFAVLRGGPLMVLRGDSLVSAGPGAELFAQKRLYALLSHGQGQALYGIANEGLFVGPSPAALSEAQPLRLEPFLTGMEAWMVENFLYLGLRLSNGNLAIGTLGGGVAEFSPEGRLLRVFSQASGLPANSVYAMGESADGSLWLALSKGIAQLSLHNPLSHWGPAQGLAEAAISAYYFEGKLYAGTFDGVFVLEGDRFRQVEGMPGYCWNLAEVQDPASGARRLFGATREGVFEVVQDKALPLGLNDGCNVLYWSERYPGKLLAGLVAGMSVLDLGAAPGTAVKPANILPISDEVRSLAVDADGQIWASTLYSGLYRVLPNGDWASFQTQQYDSVGGVSLLDGCRAFGVGQEVWVSASGGNFLVSGKDLLPLKKHSRLETLASAIEGKTILYASERDGGIWMLLGLPEGGMGERELVHWKDGQLRTFSHALARLSAQEMFNAHASGGDLYWVCTENGVYRLDTRLGQAGAAGQTFIGRVGIEPDSTVFFGGRLAGASEGAFAYAHNSLEFEFGSSYYQGPVQYSHWLEGHDAGWSAWSDRRVKEYTDLFEGEYTMRVKARLPDGRELAPASYGFRVQPPAYRTWWAYTLYALLAAGAVAGIVKLNSLRHQADKRRLERLVRERTAEIRAKNEEIAQQHEEILQQNEVLEAQKSTIEKRNKDMADSVKAAKRILSALHTPAEQLSLSLPDSFLFFQPRDVVSGDFYWVESVGDLLIVAAVDCTGHGVPGAFMSVIGHTLLKDTVHLYQTHEPHQILNNLHYLVSDSLSRERKGSIEGMDMTLCVIDRAKQELHFAGARNPLLYIRDGELHVLKGDKLPVGGIRIEKPRDFTLHTLPLSGDTCFYLFSDGFQDQFGGDSGDEKFTPKRLRELLLAHHALPMPEQGQAVAQAFEDWKGRQPQTDDVLVMGFRV